MRNDVPSFMNLMTLEPEIETTTAPRLFTDLPLREEVQLAVRMAGYITPTDIQAEIVPSMLEGRDVLAQSQTGTGKTAAFALPILSRIDFDVELPQVLVLAPTRELATQVAKSFEKYAACLPKFRIAAIYGGADYEPQLRQLKRGVQVVVGTPGRVIDHVRRGTLKLSGIRCLVLDEGDEMLNMGFIEDIEYVLSQAPEEKQMALFSATMPDPIRRIADQYLKSPAEVTIRRRTLTNESIEQRAVFIDESDKPELLARLLEIEETDGVLVFTKTKESTIEVSERLSQLGLSAAALNGDLPQARRQRTVDQLKSGALDIVVATDVAARGLDVQRISHVINYDLPHDSESYVHRIGRTGRAGRRGIAIVFLTPRQRGKLRLIEKATKQTITVMELPTAKDVNAGRIERFKTKIRQALEADGLELFARLVGEVAKETEQPIEQVAAAAAYLAQGGRPFLVKDLPLRELRSKTDRMSGRRGDDGDRRDGGDRGERGERGFVARKPRRPLPNMLRYRIEVGWLDGVRPGNIVGAVANEAGIDGRSIGNIQIMERFSTIDLPNDLDRAVLDTLQRTWVSGKQLRLRPFREDESPSEGSFQPERPAKRKFKQREGADGATYHKFGKGPVGKKPFKKRKKPS
jgi:ATP-dependent RNA helicase DeaD